MSDDLYKAPESNLINKTAEENATASRWQRLAASLLDGLIMGLFTFPIMYFTGGFARIAEGENPSIIYSLGIAVAGVIFFFALNIKFLLTNGQTIGKKALDIKIVTLDNEVPALNTNIIPRYAMYFIPGQIPYIGQLIALINILLIFGKERRCGHDMVANTKVVICQKP